MNNNPEPSNADYIKETIAAAIHAGLTPEETAEYLSHSDNATDQEIARTLCPELFEDDTKDR